MPTPIAQITSSLQAASALGQMQARVWLAQVKAGCWAEQTRYLANAFRSQQAVTGYMLHPCLIEQRATLIHAPDLGERDPAFFQQLQDFAKANDYQLLADRRQRDCTVAEERRRHWLPMLVLSLGVSTATADDIPASSQTLQLFNTHHTHSHDLETGHPASDGAEAATTAVQSQLADESLPAEELSLEQQQSILEILRAHFQADSSDPAYVQQDLEAMAAYFARYPQAVSLLKSLSGHAWQLRYRKDTFATQVRGTQLRVKAATVNFDSRAAAQLRKHKACVGEQRGACIASPADALLHELLHVESALLDAKTFIAQGGLNSVVYPFQHEAAVIKRENQLYRAMSALDGDHRPSRRHHSGSLVASSCVTCLN